MNLHFLKESLVKIIDNICCGMAVKLPGMAFNPDSTIGRNNKSISPLLISQQEGREKAYRGGGGGAGGSGPAAERAAAERADHRQAAEASAGACAHAAAASQGEEQETGEQCARDYRSVHVFNLSYS